MDNLAVVEKRLLQKRAAPDQLAATFAGAGVLLDDDSDFAEDDSDFAAGAESLLAGSLADVEPLRLSVR